VKEMVCSLHKLIGRAFDQQQNNGICCTEIISVTGMNGSKDRDPWPQPRLQDASNLDRPVHMCMPCKTEIISIFRIQVTSS
jgi:hypothetical protein